MRTLKPLAKIIVFTAFVVALFSAGSCSKSSSSTFAPTNSPTKSPLKQIISITFNQFNPAVTAVSDYGQGQYWRATQFPVGTDLTKVVPTIVVSDKATVTSPAPGMPIDMSIISGVEVTAEDGSTASYSLTSLLNSPSGH